MADETTFNETREESAEKYIDRIYEAFNRHCEIIHDDTIKKIEATAEEDVEARKKIANNNHIEIIRDFDYRPFDTRKIYYSADMIDWGRQKYMHHFIEGDNFGLMICRQTAIDSWEHIGITKTIADDSRVSNRSKERGYILPLYHYPEINGQQSIEETTERKPNLNI